MSIYKNIRDRLSLPENFVIFLLGKNDYLNPRNSVKYVQSFEFERFSDIYQFECYLDQLSTNIKTYLVTMLEGIEAKKLVHPYQIMPNFLNSTKIGGPSKFHDYLRDFQNSFHNQEDLAKISKNYMYGETEKLYFTSEKIYVYLKTWFESERNHMNTLIEIRIADASNFFYV